MKINRRQFAHGGAVVLGTALISSRASAAQFTYKLGNSTPAGHPFNNRLMEASKEILDQTNGRLNIQIFPNSQLGGDNDLMSQVRSGAIQFFPGAGLILASILPVIGIDGMGFAFPSYKEVWAAMDGDLGAYVRKQIEAHTNLVPLNTMWDLGYRQITNSVRPIEKPADLVGLKLRVPGAPPLVSLFQSLEVSPVSMQYGEVYTALQTKVVDGQENPLSQIDSGKFYEVQKYLSLTNHVWDGFWMVANGEAWKRLPPDIQAVVNKIFTEKSMAERDDLQKLNAGLVDKLKSKGLQVNAPDTGPFQAKLHDAGFYAQWKPKMGDKAWSMLEKYTGKLA
jgi:tripartite ATP-independent transporter DctP family solute receptor